MTEYIMDYNLNASVGEYAYKRREEVVRCRDCKDYRDSDATCHSWQWHNWDAAIEVDPNGFCAWGERRDA